MSNSLSLGDRVADINYMKSELNDEIDKMVAESEALSHAKRIAEKYLTETENPLHVTQECLYNREKRAGIDLVHDMVEKSLIGVSRINSEMILFRKNSLQIVCDSHQQHH